MFLDYIEISNFRPYYGNQRINFGFNDNKNLTIILANNGSGKTSLVNALTWCLYGKELHDIKDKTEPIYNIKAAEDAENEGIDVLEVKVKIKFYYIDDNLNKVFFTVSREISFEKWFDNQWTSEYKSSVYVDETGKDILDGDDAQYIIDNKIPENMFQYFFFNGATLSHYFDNSNSKLSLKNSIKQVSQIDLIDNMSNHLSSTLSTLNKRYKKLNPDNSITFYNLSIEKKLSKVDELESNIKKMQEQLDEAHENVIRCNEKLKKSDSNSVQSLAKKRDKLEIEKANIKNSIKKLTDDYNDLILELYPITILFNELVKSLKIADEARSTKTTPPLIEKTLLNDILDDGYCICGIKLDDHPECVEELKNRLKKTSGIKTDEFYNVYYDIKNCLIKLREIPKIETLRDTLQNNKNHLTSIKAQIDNINVELKNIDVEHVKVLEEQRDKNQRLMDKLRNNISDVMKRMEKLKNEIVQLKKRRDESILTTTELEKLAKKIEFCEFAKTFALDLNKDVQNHIRKKVSDKTNEQFVDIGWANNKYTNVKIEDDYNVSITKSNGRTVRPGDLSDGEENLLALSFMMALNNLNGFEIPLIIDAPLEKLDKEKRLDFTSNLHKYTSDKQIIFLFTDSQYTSDVRANILDNVFDEYELIPQEFKTEIVKHD